MVLLCFHHSAQVWRPLTLAKPEGSRDVSRAMFISTVKPITSVVTKMATSILCIMWDQETKGSREGSSSARIDPPPKYLTTGD